MKKYTSWIMPLLVIGSITFMIASLLYNMGWMRGYEKANFNSRKIDCEYMKVSELPAWCLQYLGIKK